ncbi:hypothetical protein D3C72_325920 [compost metagenome]
MSKNCNDKKGFQIDELFEVIPNGQTIKFTFQELNPEIVKQIESNLGLLFINENESAGEVCFAHCKELRPEYKQSFTPLDLLNYCYGVLHSPNYREKCNGFLNRESSNIPFPTDPNHFWELVVLGKNLRQIHLPIGPASEKNSI